ncbi:hypothetical protein PVAP13_6NG156200 [Panicum virgatum]|uniref:Uncharacterized protein n=1 Tax=Panicum virgatum TaxID=38727 RepID=A0A8T0QXC8_PANVG|nr:hypothetical protein PVAP13_6NG156200 [Panicum virgatum]
MGGALCSKSVCWFQKFSRDALHEIHELVAKYDGTISERDKYIRGVLLTMSYDIAHHMNSFADNLINIARDKYRWANIKDFGVPRG